MTTRSENNLEAAAAMELLALEKSGSITISQLAQIYRTGMDIPGVTVRGMGSPLGGPRNPYRESVWVYVCISKLGANVARVPLRVSKKKLGGADGTRGLWGTKYVRFGRKSSRRIASASACEKSVRKAAEGEIVEFGDVFNFIRKPNSGQTWREFIEQDIICLYRDGRVHWLFDEMKGYQPRSMYIIPGRTTEPVHDRTGKVDQLGGWFFRDPNGNRYPVVLSECMTYQIYDPDHPLDGMTPLEPARLAVISDYNASMFNAAMFANNCEPGPVLETDKPFNPELDTQMKTSWQQRHAGPMNAKRLAVLWGGLKLKEHGQSLSDMVFADGKQLDREEVCAVFGVPASVAGFFGTSGDSNAYTDNELERFWQDTMAPLLERIAEAMNVNLVPLFGEDVDVWFDVEEVPTFQKLRRSQTDTAVKYFAMGRPFEDIDEWLGLGFPRRDWDKTGYVPVGLVPANESATPAQPEGPGPEDEPLAPETGSDDGEDEPPDPQRETNYRPTDTRAVFSIEERSAETIWRSFERSYYPLARRLAAMLSARYSIQARKLQRALKDILPSAGRAAADSHTKDDGLVGRLLVDVFDDADESKKFRIRVTPIISDGIELGLRQAFIEAGHNDEAGKEQVGRIMHDPKILAAINTDSVRFAQRDDLRSRSQLRTTLREGLAAGEDYRHLADRVQAVMQNRRDDALRIARNTVSQAVSQARHEGNISAGITHEVWISSRGAGQRRPAHVAAEAYYAANPKPVGDPFIIDGCALRFPRDPMGEAGEIINCQCLALGKVLNEAAPTKAIRTFAFFDYLKLLSERSPQHAA